MREPAGFGLVAELELGERGVRPPRHEGRVAASHRLEAATGIEQRVEPAGQVAAQNSHARPAVLAEVRQRSVGKVAWVDAGDRVRRLVELALLHERVGLECGHERREERTGSPGLGRIAGLAGLCLCIGQVASMDERLRPERLGQGKVQHRAVPLRIRERDVVPPEGLVQIRHRQHVAGDQAGSRRGLSRQQRPVAEHPARQGNGPRRGHVGAEIEVRQKRQQPPLRADRLVGQAADALQALEGLRVEPRLEDRVADES